MKRSMENAGKKEYIERDALIKGFTSDGCRFVYGNSTVKAIVSRIMATPAVDVVPVVHGEWVYDHWSEFKCSNCGTWSNSKPYKGKENFCPNCGADMRKKVE